MFIFKKLYYFNLYIFKLIKKYIIKYLYYLNKPNNHKSYNKLKLTKKI